MRDRTGFLLTRTILGLTEAGYIPGAMFTLSTWYKKEEITKRIAVFFFGMFGGTAISPLLGAGLLKLDTKGGLSGWQWIFLSNNHDSTMSNMKWLMITSRRSVVCDNCPDNAISPPGQNDISINIRQHSNRR